jgi:hypothetical protein
MFRYIPHAQTESTPNVVVDGSANRATVLTLSHWPGAPTPDRWKRDLSAEIAFAFLDDGAPSSTDVVTNNHYDQDGLVSVFALIDPEAAQRHRELLIDVAAAGDFGTYRDRRAARASMVIAHWSDEGLGYDETLGRLVDVALDPERHRSIWETEDEHLTASERAIAAGTVTIEEVADLDLAIVTIPEDGPFGSAHRFAHETFEGIHPMAVHNATERFRLLIVHGPRYRHVDRYETWVQYRSRATLPRVDLRPLATELSGVDAVEWLAGSPDDLVPILRHAGRSALPVADLIDRLSAALAQP